MSRENDPQLQLICPDGTTVSVSLSITRLSPFLQEIVPQPFNNEQIFVLIPGWIIREFVRWVEFYIADLRDSNLLSDHQHLICMPLQPYDYFLAFKRLFELYAFNLSAEYLKIERMCFLSSNMMRYICAFKSPEQIEAMLQDGTNSQKADLQLLLNFLENNPN